MTTKVLTRRHTFNAFPTEEEIRASNRKMYLMLTPLAVITFVDCLIGIFRKIGGGSFVGEEIRGAWYNVNRFFSYKWKYFWKDDFRRTVDEYKTRVRETKDQTSEQFRDLKQRMQNFEVSEDDILAGMEFMAIVPYLGFVTYIVVMAVIVASLGVWKYYPTPDPTPVAVLEKKIEFTPQEADVQDANYGPWFNRGEVLKKVNDPTFLNMVKVDSTGTIQYSKTVVPGTDGFTALNFHERVTNPLVTDSGQISFHDQERNTFTINPNQVFIFEGYKSKAFVFDKGGKLFGIDPKNLKITKIGEK